MGDIPAQILLAALVLLLVSAGIEDLRRREIGNGKNLAIALLAPAFWWANGMAPWPDMAVQLGLALAVFALFAAAFQFGWMGGGDVKLIGALALWLPLHPLLTMLARMAVIGGLLTILFLIDHRIRRRGDAPEIPYGVAIAIAGMLVLPGTES